MNISNKSQEAVPTARDQNMNCEPNKDEEITEVEEEGEEEGDDNEKDDEYQDCKLFIKSKIFSRLTSQKVSQVANNHCIVCYDKIRQLL